MRRWSNGYDCGLPSRLSGFETAFLHKAKNLGKCGELLFGRSPRILLRKIKEAGESPSRRTIFIKNENNNFNISVDMGCYDSKWILGSICRGQACMG